MALKNHRFLRACRGEDVDVTPVWFMRQAGRYQPEYREIRRRHTLLEICRQPELAAEVTILPVQQLDVDAAILFSDITVLYEPLGVSFDVVKDVGPVIENPLRTREDVARLGTYEIGESLPYVMETIELLVKELSVPLIAFAGAPFTLASYLIEGGPTRNFLLTRKMMYSQPDLWHDLMDKLTTAVAAHLRSQAQAGAAALQIFDSWVGTLDAAAYRRFVFPHMQRLFQSLADLPQPLIHFAVRSEQLLAQQREAGGHVIGVDWRLPIDTAWEIIGEGVGIQGNLDPALLLGPWSENAAAATDILQRVAGLGRPGHIFNLGHGVTPLTPVDRLRRLVEFVREESLRLQAAGQAQGPGSGQGDVGTQTRPREESTGLPGYARDRTTDDEPAFYTAGLPVRRRPGRVLPPAGDGPKEAVLLMAYGSPASLEDVEAYFTHIRAGRRPPAQRVAELEDLYRLIGGVSPLTPISLSLAGKLEEQLGLPVYLGMRHAPPFIYEAVDQMVADGVQRATAIALAPHYSRMSGGAYTAAVEKADRQQKIQWDFVQGWGDHPLLVAALSRRVTRSLHKVWRRQGREPGPGLPPETALLFTAHSLPQRILQWDDPYPVELKAASGAVAQAAGVEQWSFAYQSESSTGEPWLGPTLEAAMEKLHRQGAAHLVVCPIGFVADHLEVYFDIDIEAQEVADELGLNLVRTDSLNDDDDLVAVLADLVTSRRQKLSGPVPSPTAGGPA